jgi:pilus assembly protein FimV
MPKISQWMVMAGLILGSGAAGAMGLGELQVVSGLNQQFKAEIPLLEAGDVALEEVRASLAPNEVFEARGITKPDLLFDFKLQVARNEKGEPVVKITSTRTVTEPALVLLIELDWAAGRLIREYTVFLSPSSN